MDGFMLVVKCVFALQKKIIRSPLNFMGKISLGISKLAKMAKFGKLEKTPLFENASFIFKYGEIRPSNQFRK